MENPPFKTEPALPDRSGALKYHLFPMVRAVEFLIPTTAISVHEIRFGLELIEQGTCRRSLETAFEAMIHSTLNSRYFENAGIKLIKPWELGST